MTEEHVPTLAEMFAACGTDIRLNVELKYYGDNAALVPAVLEVLRTMNSRAGRSSLVCNWRL